MSPARDLGTKYVCWKCETKFYDLHKPVPTCPKCGADQRDQPVKPARSTSRAARAPAREKAVAAPVAEPEVEAEDALPEDEEEVEDDDEDDEP